VRYVTMVSLLSTVALFLLTLPNNGLAGGNEELAGRVLELCQAKKNKQWDVAYDMYFSEYRSKVTREKFLKKRRGVVFGDCTIEKITIGADEISAKVSIKTDAVIQGSLMPGSLSFQRWKLEDGQWFLILKDGFAQMFEPISKKG